jgi:hypothetical protein
MTSVLRHYAQTDPKTGFFIVLSASIPVWRDISGQTSHSVMDISGFQAAFTPGTVSTAASTLLKDLGRQIVIYNSNIPTNPHVAIMRQVMLVNGTNIEGISDVPPFASNLYYICTWNDGFNILFPLAIVSRTG